MSDGNAHNPLNPPLVLVERRGGALATGSHLYDEKDHSMADLYFFLMNRMGAPADRWADSTGELAGLGDPGFVSPES